MWPIPYEGPPTKEGVRVQPTTYIDVSGLQLSLDYIVRARSGRFVAYLKVNGIPSPALEAFVKKQAEGKDGIGEVHSVTALSDQKKIAIEFSKGVDRDGAAKGVGRFLSNAKRNCPSDTSPFFEKEKVADDPAYGQPVNAMAVSSVNTFAPPDKR